MKSINKVFISGNLTKDPELRSSSSTDVLSFSVAVNDRRKNADGEWEDVPNFVGCTVFGRRAASLAERLKKGDRVSLEGKLRWSQWERDGQKRSALDVIVEEIELISKSRSGDAPEASPAPVAPMDLYDGLYDEDVTF